MTGHHSSRPHGAGKSSYDLVDHERALRELNLRKGMTFLDMACGPGDYAIAVAKLLGSEGMVYAADLWVEALVKLQQKAEARNLANIRTVVGDVSRPLPIESATVDACLIATVLHDFVREGVAFEALQEAARVLKPGALLGVLEFKKMDGPPGPSIEIRLTAEEVERLVSPHGFIKRSVSETGPYTYLITFKRRGSDHAVRP
jgi:ubiquinone/menaquinone biosynthesis C-methylase UbiE